jgi:hypothetical protein
MANNVSLAHVLVLDTTADNIVASTTPVRVRKVRLVNANAAAASVAITDAGGTTAKVPLAAGANSSDTLDFYAHPFLLLGLKLTITGGGAGTVVYVYSEQA